MAPISVVRICAFLSLIALSSSFSEMRLYDVVIFTGLAHYTLSVVYGWNNILAIARRPAQAASFIGLLGASIWLFISNFSLTLLFLPHHVFNEVYLTKKEVYRSERSEIEDLTRSAIFLHGLLYTQILGVGKVISSLYWLQEFMPPLIAVASVVFFICLWRARKIIGWRRTLDACVFEAIAFFTLYLTKFTPISFFQVVLYHFIFWAAYPLTTMMAHQKKTEAIRYVLINVGALLVVGLIAPFSPLPWHIDAMLWSQAFLVGSFLHIMSSFAVSRAQPDWIWRFFLPPPRVVPIPAAMAPEQALVSAGT